MPLEDADIAEVTLLLSAERLAKLMQLTGSARTAIELHQETLRLGAALINVTASIEIALRNTICENLSQHFGVPGWLLNPPAPFRWKELEENKIKLALDSARRAEYAKLTQAEKGALDVLAFPNGRPANTSHLKRAKKRREQIVVTNGKVISELTLYIWKRLYGPDYEQTLWRTTLKRIFPNRKVKRPDVADNLENIYQSRNRLAHHEPVLHKRFADTMASIKFITENLGVTAPSQDTPLAQLVAEDVAEVNVKADALHARLAAFRI